MGRLRLGKGQIKHESPLLCFFLFASYCCEWNSKAKARSEGKTTDGPHIQRNGSRYGRDGPRNGRWDEWRIWTWKCIWRIGLGHAYGGYGFGGYGQGGTNIPWPYGYGFEAAKRDCC